ncbi:MAG: NrsF family protein [Hyphomonadaceae bacterium]
MKTDDFIRDLASTAPPLAPKRGSLFVHGFAGLTFASVAFIGLSGVRPDLGDAWLSTGLKVSFGALAAAAMAPLMTRIAGQSLHVRNAIVWPALVLTLAAAVSVVGLAMTTDAMRWTRWTGSGVPDCLWQIPLIAAPMGAALILAMRRFGPTRLSLAGLAIGAVAGGLAAIPYSLFCPIDFAPYVATWYTAAFAICAALGATMGARLLRW